MFGDKVYGFTPIKKRNNYEGFEEFDSLMINPSKNCFFRNVEFKQGDKAKDHNHSAGSIIDFIMHIEGCDNKTAIKKLFEFANNGIDYSNSKYNHKNFTETKKEFVVPIKYDYSNNARKYLCDIRKIDKSVFVSLLNRGYLYEEKGKYRNIICAAYNENGKMVFAQRCSTLKNIPSDKRKWDVSGSDYTECWFINNNASSLIVTESCIDTMSFMSLLNTYGKRYNNYNHLGLTGSNKVKAVCNILEKYPHIQKLYLGLDSDEAGDVAVKYIENWAEKNNWTGTIINMQPDRNLVYQDFEGNWKVLKDINDLQRYQIFDPNFIQKLKKL